MDVPWKCHGIRQKIVMVFFLSDYVRKINKKGIFATFASVRLTMEMEIREIFCAMAKRKSMNTISNLEKQYCASSNCSH